MESATSGLTAALQNLNKSVSNLNTSFSNYSNRQRQFQQQSRQTTSVVEQQIGAFSNLQRAIFIGSQFLQASQAINELADRYQGFNRIRQRVINAFAKDGPEIENSFTRARDAVGRFFSGVEKIEKSTKTITGFGNQALGTEEKIIKLADGVKTVETRVISASGIITKRFVEVSGEAANIGKRTITGANDVKRATETIKKSVTGVFGPGTTSFKEFESKASAGFFTRISTLAQQAFQNIRFHASRIFSAPLESIKNFGSAILNVFTSIRSGASGFGVLGNAISSVQERFSTLVERFNTLRDRGGPLGQVLGTIGARLAALGPAGAAGVAVAGIGLVSAAAGKSILSLAQKASNLQESVNAMNVTLGAAAPRFNELIGDTTKLGVTQLELNEALTPIVPLLQNAGKSGDDLATGLNQLSRRAVDLGSIFNKTTGDVLVKLGAAIRGEIEPARALGITFNAAGVEAEAAALGFEKVAGQLSEEAKTLARFNLVLKQSTFAAGDYANTSNDLANATRNFRTVLAELGFEFSAVFLPAAEKIRASLNQLVTQAGPLASGFFARLTPLVTQLGEVISDVAIDGLALSFVQAASAASGVFAPAITSVIKILELALNAFESINAITGRILPGNLNILTVALTRLLIGKQVEFTVRALGAALAFIGGILPGVAAATNALAAGLARIVPIIGPILTGFALITGRLNQVKQSADSAADAFTRTFDFSKLDAFGLALDGVDEKIKKAKADLEGGIQLNIFGFRLKPFEDVNKQAAILNANEKEREELLARQQIQMGVLGAVAQQTGESQAEVFERAKLAGIDFLSLPFNQANSTIESLTNNFKEAGASLADLGAKVKSELESAAQAFETLDRVQESIRGTNQTINDLIVDRTKIINDVIAKQFEEFNAAKSVRDIERQIFDTAKERGDLEQRLLDIASQRQEIEQQFRDIATERLDIERQIAELLAPPDPGDVQEAQDRLTRSQINLNKAKKEQLKLEDEILNKSKESEDLQVDLTGLSLDEVRSRLASARAAAAAQRARRSEEDTSEELLTDDEKRELAAIGVRDAQRDVTKAQEDLIKLQKPEITNREAIQRLQDQLVGLTKQEEGLRKQITGTVRDEEDIQLRIQRIDQDAPGLILQKQLAEQTYQQTLSGEIGIQNTIRGLNDQIATQRNTLKNLIGEERDALTLLREGEEAVTREVNARIGRRLAEMGIVSDTKKELDSLLRTEISKTVTSAIQSSISEIPGGSLSGGLAQVAAAQALSPKVIQAITDRFLLDPTADLREIIKQVLRQLKITVPGFSAEGSVITGSPGPMGQLMHVGEYSKPEAILPLTKPGRFASVLQQSLPYAHPAVRNMIGQMYEGSVLDGVPKISLTGGQSQALRARKPSYASGSLPFQSSKPTRLEQKLDRLIQLQEEANTKEQGINAPITVNGVKDPDHAARKAVRELEKQLRRRR